MKLPRVHDVGAMAPPVTVVGDVHLAEGSPAVADAFFAFLRGMREGGGTLVLLGDLFDAWIGRAQADTPFAARVLDALRATAGAGVRLAFVRGNRDFTFDGADGLELELWPDVVRTTWGDRRVVLSHGDLLCTADLDYLALRRVLRSWPLELLRRSLPPRALFAVARRLRRASTKAQALDPTKHLGIHYDEARRWLEAYEADALVLGHVHTGVHHTLPGARPRDVYVLKDWDAGANGVRFDGDGIRLQALGSAPA